MPEPKKPQAFNALQTVLQNIIRKKAVIIEYHSNYKQETTERAIEPLGIFYMNQSWYILAYCLLRESYRTFKIDRIQKITPGDKDFIKIHPEVQLLVSQIYKDTPSVRISIQIEKSVLRNMGDDKYYYGLYKEEQQNDHIVQHYLTYSLKHFSRWYLSFADQASILEPTELKDIIRELISKIKV